MGDHFNIIHREMGTEVVDSTGSGRGSVGGGGAVVNMVTNRWAFD
jgi:hypothetical protein